MNKSTYMLNVLLVCVLLTGSVFSQTTELFKTNGNKITDPCGNEFIMRGVNYSLADDWNFPGNLNNGKELSAQIIQANPNTVRIQWYVDYGQPARPQLTLTGLDSVISRFAAADIATVLEIHDFTHIHTDTTLFNTQVVGWWTSQPVLQLIEKHQAHLFVNVANEYGPAMYPAPNYTLNPNYATEITTWVAHYRNVITRLRNAGIEVPIMIDAPNYGMDYQTVIDNATMFNNHDPLNRIVMSCHAYWNETAGGMESIVNQLAGLTVPVVFGEVGNVDFSCNAIQMNSLLTKAQERQIGWLAWTWNRDECATRNMTSNEPGNPASTTDGQFSTLTTYGQTIVNNATFGLVAHAQKADFSCLLGVETVEQVLDVYPNPVQDVLHVSIDQTFNEVEIVLVDLNGRVRKTHAGTQLDTSDLEHGVYFAQVSIDGIRYVVKVLK